MVYTGVEETQNVVFGGLMISKHKIKLKDGKIKTNVRIVEGYRPGPGQSPKQRQIKNFGYAEDYPDQAAFWKMVEQAEADFKESKERIVAELDPKRLIKDAKRFNLGHKYLESIYNFLELDKFFEGLQYAVTYDLNSIFKYLVIERILNPDSIRAMLQRKNSWYGCQNAFQYHQAVRALDYLEENMEQLQDHLNRVIERKVGRTKEYLFYDTTNFYFEKDYPEEGTLGQKGVSKEHSVNPIVQFGLFMDSNKLPVRMQVFPGNTSDSITYLPMIKAMKQKEGFGRIISVADKGMNSDANVSYIYSNGDGYVFSQVLKGRKGTRYQAKMFDESAYTWNADGTYKYQLFEEDYQYTVPKEIDESGKKTAKRKVLIYWKKSVADREAKKRKIKLEKAAKFGTNNAYGLTHDATQYVSSTHVDEETGIVANKTIYSVNMAKADEDAKYDGYFCIVTSELSYDRAKIHEVYGQLINIEDSFRICKSDLNTRPIYVYTDEHIKAHLLVCFTSLLIIRLLGYKMDSDYTSTERIRRALSGFGCSEISKGIMLLNMTEPNQDYIQKLDECGNAYYTLSLSEEDETISDLLKIQKAFGEEFQLAHVKQERLAKYLKTIKFAITKK